VYRDIVHTTRYLQGHRLASIRPMTTDTRISSPLREIVGNRLIAMGQWLAGTSTSVRSTPVGSRT
jgi:hypothetical protein